MTGTTQGGARQVFISYRRTDTAYPAGWLYDRLAERFGDERVFKDVDSVEPGEDFIEAVTTAVSECDVLLALIGTTWLSCPDPDGGRRLDQPDDLVRIEIETALRRGVRVIPVLVDGATMPAREDVPSSLQPLVRRQAVALSPLKFTSDLAVLMRAITTVSSPGPEGPPGWPGDPQRPGESAWPSGPPPRPGSRQPAPSPSGTRFPASLGVALGCAAVGAVLLLIGAGQPLLVDGNNLFDGTTAQDIQHVLPPLSLLAAALLVTWPTVAAGWLVGAAITVLTLDYASTVIWAATHAGYEDGQVGVASLAYRTVGAAFVLVAAFVAPSAMARPRPPVAPLAFVALAACGLVTLMGAGDMLQHMPDEMTDGQATLAAMAPPAALVLAVLVVAAHLSSAAAAAPMVTAAGATSAVLALLERMVADEQGYENPGAITLTVFSLTAFAAVGVWLWVAPAVAGGARRPARSSTY